MNHKTPDQLRAAIDAIDIEVARYPEDATKSSVLDRVSEIMGVASAIDASRASFALGQVFEALRPLRARNRLLASRQAIVTELRKLETKPDEEA